jgi:diguanylate cyclase (GGDEF)-like protein
VTSGKTGASGTLRSASDSIRSFVDDLASSLGRCSITLYLRDGESLNPRAHAGLGTLIERIPLAQGMLGRVARTGQAELIDDLQPPTRGIRSEIAVPVGEGEMVVGVLDVQSTEQLTPRDRELLELVARQASRTMLQAEQYEEGQRRAARAETLLGAGIALTASLDPDTVTGAVLDQLAHLLAFDGAALLLLDEGNHLRLVEGRGPFALNAELFAGFSPEDSPLTHETARTGKPLLISDIPVHFGGYPPLAYEWLGSAIVAPLVAQDRPLGVVIIGARAHAQYTPEDAAAAAELARHAAIALRNAQVHAAMARAAETDALTGVSNRRALMDRLEREMERARRYRHPLAVLFFDIDRFKTFNDTYGHQFGDLVLKELANIARRSVRSIDLVGRYGGEEFVAVLPETDGDRALIVAERLRQNVVRYPFTLPSGERVGVTISVGVAVYPVDADTVTDLVHTADAALYAAKAGGRNRVVYKPVSGHEG